MMLPRAGMARTTTIVPTGTPVASMLTVHALAEFRSMSALVIPYVGSVGADCPQTLVT